MSKRLISPLEVRALVAEHLPRSFGRAFANALAGAYSRANQMGQNFDPPERSRTVGHNRWGLGEKAFRTAGRLAGLRIEDRKAACGFPYVALHAGPIVMTQSHVGSRQDMPRPSEFRVEQAATNQGELFAATTDDVASDQAIYLVALHGSETDRFADRPDFLRLIAPTPDFASLIATLDFPLAIPTRVPARRQTTRPVAGEPLNLEKVDLSLELGDLVFELPYPLSERRVVPHELVLVNVAVQVELLQEVQHGAPPLLLRLPHKIVTPLREAEY